MGNGWFHQTGRVNWEVSMTKRIAVVSLCGATLAAVASQTRVAGSASARESDSAEPRGWTLQPKIVWATTRDDPAINPFLAGEIYMMNPDFTDIRRLTFTDSAANFFGVLSPTGKRIVFDSNR